AADASAFLVEGKPGFLGGLIRAEGVFEQWERLHESAKSGRPERSDDVDVKENPFWEDLVIGIAPLSFPVAQLAAQHLGLAQRGAISILDLGGGSGVFSAIWLQANRQATATQLDWSNVNALARKFVGSFGVGDRFHTIDGDMRTDDFGTAKHHLVVYSHIA